MIKRRERLLLIVAITCLLAFAGDRLVVRPLLAPWKARNARIKELHQQIENGKMMTDRRQSIQERWNEMLVRSLPQDQSAAENTLLSAVGEWAKASRLNVTAMKPRWIQDEDPAADQLEVLVSASGDIAAVTRFLYEMETDPLAVKLLNFDIRARDDKGKNLILETRFTGLVLAEGKAS